MSDAMKERIRAAAKRVQLLGKTSRSQTAAVVAQCLGLPLEQVQRALDDEEQAA